MYMRIFGFYIELHHSSPKYILIHIYTHSTTLLSIKCIQCIQLMYIYIDDIIWYFNF